MTTLERRELTRRDYLKNKLLQRGAYLAPIALALPPFAVFGTLVVLNFGTAAAAVYFFLALISFGIGFAIGVLLLIAMLVYRNYWLKNLRESLAIDGIKTAEVEWFKNELTTQECKSLKEIGRKNLLLADAFRETLASRLTATRILKSTKQELLLVGRRENKLKYLQNANTKNLQDELTSDRQRLEKVKKEADELLAEAKTRLETIEAAANRGTNLAGNEQALERLLAKTAELPYALEAARTEEAIRRELDEEVKIFNENK